MSTAALSAAKTALRQLARTNVFHSPLFVRLFDNIFLCYQVFLGAKGWSICVFAILLVVLQNSSWIHFEFCLCRKNYQKNKMVFLSFFSIITVPLHFSAGLDWCLEAVSQRKTKSFPHLLVVFNFQTLMSLLMLQMHLRNVLLCIHFIQLA